MKYLIIIFSLFLLTFFLVSKYHQASLSDEPVVLTRSQTPDIVMLGTPDCKYCQMAREFFSKHNLNYTEYNIETSDKHMQMFYLLGGKGTPLIIINKQVIHGYDEAAIRAAL